MRGACTRCIRGLSEPVSALKAAAQAPTTTLPVPEAPAAEFADVLNENSGRLLEVVRYAVRPENRAGFIALMAELRRLRLRNGARVWRLYEDIAHPERFAELWVMESWTDHLREAGRMDAGDLATLARAAAFHHGDAPPEASRYLNLNP